MFRRGRLVLNLLQFIETMLKRTFQAIKQKGKGGNVQGKYVTRRSGRQTRLKQKDLDTDGKDGHSVIGGRKRKAADMVTDEHAFEDGECVRLLGDGTEGTFFHLK
jgi:hypothetical protein